MKFSIKTLWWCRKHPQEEKTMNFFKYGGIRFFYNQIYRLSNHLDDKAIAGRRVWVKELISQFGCDYIKVWLVDNNEEYYVKPRYVVPEK